MAALAARDAQHLLRFLTVADELSGDDPFAPAVLEELGKLVDADGLSYCEQDRVRERPRCSIWRPGDEVGKASAVVSYWEIAAEHPVCSRRNRGDFRPLKLSDFLALRQLRRTRVYALWFRPAGVDHELTLPIPSPLWHTKTFLFDRLRGRRDFSERDRLVLSLLQPHLGRLWRAAQTRQRLRTALVGLDSASDHDRRGVILLRPDGRIDYASPPARRLIHEYFDTPNGTELPPSLADWLESGTRTLTRHLENRRVTVDRTGDALLLEETRDPLGLTPRERQILAWVARGKTNPEIAQILVIAPTTVRTHLENIYAKLDVRTRTAAVTRLLGTLDNKEQQATTRSETW